MGGFSRFTFERQKARRKAGFLLQGSTAGDHRFSFIVRFALEARKP
jgi:hypothetical protein